MDFSNSEVGLRRVVGEMGKLRVWKQLISPRVANYIEEKGFYLPERRLVLLFMDHNEGLPISSGA